MFPNKFDIKNTYGFTILEIMIAMAIFSIGILGVVQMQLSATSGNTSSRGWTEATTIGQQQLEMLMSLDYNNALLQDVNGDGTNQDADDDGTDDNGGDFGLDETNLSDQSVVIDTVYNVFWNIAVDEPVANSKRIRLIVQWRSSGFARKEIAFNCIKVSM